MVAVSTQRTLRQSQYAAESVSRLCEQADNRLRSSVGTVIGCRLVGRCGLPAARGDPGPGGGSRLAVVGCFDRGSAWGGEQRPPLVPEQQHSRDKRPLLRSFCHAFAATTLGHLVRRRGESGISAEQVEAIRSTLLGMLRDPHHYVRGSAINAIDPFAADPTVQAEIARIANSDPHFSTKPSGDVWYDAREVAKSWLRKYGRPNE